MQDFCLRTNMLKGFFLKQSFILWFIKKCQNCTCKVNYFCQKSTEYQFRRPFFCKKHFFPPSIFAWTTFFSKILWPCMKEQYKITCNCWEICPWNVLPIGLANSWCTGVSWGWACSWIFVRWGTLSWCGGCCWTLGRRWVCPGRIWGWFCWEKWPCVACVEDWPCKWIMYTYVGMT